MGMIHPTIRLMLVDDTSLFRAGLKEIFNSVPYIQVVAEASEEGTAEEFCRVLKPDVALIESDMLTCTGVEVTKKIKQANPSTQVLILSSVSDNRLLAQTLNAGAAGVTLKTDSCAKLISDIERVSEGNTVIPEPLFKTIVADFLQRTQSISPERLELLTAREKEVLKYMGTGASNKDISEALHISPYTVQNHVVRVLKKLQLDNRAKAAAYALNCNLDA